MQQRRKVVEANLRQLFWRKRYVFLVGGVIGAGLYLLIFGGYFLNPWNVNWTYGGGDISQHQVGWELYRQSPWSLPIGRAQNLVYPDGASVVYSDSIPIAAILAKTASPLFSAAPFQYFGLFVFVNFILQGMLLALLISYMTKRWSVIVAITIIGVLAPPMLMRTLGHDALTSQWLIIASFCLMIYRRHLVSFKRHLAAWLTLILIAISIHPYLAAMVIVLYATDLIWCRIPMKRVVKESGIIAIVSILFFWLIGGFVTYRVAAHAMGEYGSDLNTFINPLGLSAYLPNLPTSAGGYEGQAYLGLGGLLLVLVAAVILICNRSEVRRHVTRRHIYAALPIILCAIFAVGSYVRLNGHQLIGFDMGYAGAILSVFRATGRFMWVVWYGLLVGSAVVIIWQMRRSSHSMKYVLIIVIITAALLQCLDILPSSAIVAKHDYTLKEDNAGAAISCSDTVASIASNAKHLVFIDDGMTGEQFTVLGVAAARNGLTLNDANLARRVVGKVAQGKQESRQAIIEKRLATDSVYATVELGTGKQAGASRIVACQDMEWFAR